MASHPGVRTPEHRVTVDPPNTLGRWSSADEEEMQISEPPHIAERRPLTPPLQHHQSPNLPREATSYVLDQNNVSSMSMSPKSRHSHSRSESVQIKDMHLTACSRARRPVLSDLVHYPIPHPYPRKAVRVHHGMTKPYSFLKSLFYVKGTVIDAIWPQLVLAVLLIVVVKTVQAVWGVSFVFNSRMITIHQILGSTLAFITVFRTNRSYDAYIEGRKLVSTVVSNLRTAIMDCYINDPSDGTAESRHRLVLLAEEFRRKSNILFAFIRQSTREAKEGFCPTSALAGKPLTSENFVLDCTRPRLVDLMTEEDFQHYSQMRVTGRPVLVIAELNLLAYQIITLSKETHVRVNIDNKMQEILACWNGMLRVVDLNIPFAYQHVVNVVMFVFVYSAPFLYATPSKTIGVGDASLLASILLGLVFYGMEAMSLRLGNPFGWDQEDHDLEKFGVMLCIDAYEIAKLAGVSEPQSYMCDELMEGLHDSRKLKAERSYIPVWIRDGVGAHKSHNISAKNNAKAL